MNSLPHGLNYIVLTNNAGHAHYDRKALGELNAGSILLFTSLEQAWEKTSGLSRVQVALVDSTLDDMDGMECVRQFKSSKENRLLPVVMVTTQGRKDYVLDAISAGCSGYVLRPYSPVTFERHLRAAVSSTGYDEIESEQLSTARDLVAREQFDEAIEEFEEIISIENESQRYFDMGMDYLHKQQFGKAIIAFNKAVKLNEMFAEAYKGLADSHKGRGDEGKYREFMAKTAEVYAVQDKFQEAKEIFVEILKADPDAINPYNTLGVNLRKHGDYQGAISAYQQALQITPDDEHLRYNIAKAFIFMKDNDSAKDQLKAALAFNPGFEEGRELLNRLEGKKDNAGKTKLKAEKKQEGKIKPLVIDI